MAVLLARVVMKAISKMAFRGLYNYLGLKFYSYSAMCKSLGDMQPTKRYTSRMRFKPILGVKVSFLA